MPPSLAAEWYWWCDGCRMRRDDDDGEVDEVVAGEGAAGNALDIKVVGSGGDAPQLLAMRGACYEVAGASALRGMHVTRSRSRAAPPNALRARVL